MKSIINSFREKLKTRKMSGVEYARYKGTSVGENCRILSRFLGSEPWLIKIGNKVTVAPKVQFITHDGSTWLFSDEKGRRQLFRRIIIGNNVFVGMGSTIMPGVKIEDEVIIAAGSVVVKSVPKGVIIGGNPAKIIGDYEKYKKNVLENYISNSEIDFEQKYRDMTLEAMDDSFKDYYIRK